MTELEVLTREYLKHFLPNEEVKYNERPDWLLVFNTVWKTKTRRELDIWYPRLRFAVEVNGATHLDPEIAKADRKKIGLCQSRGIRLFHVWKPRDLERINEWLKRRSIPIADADLPDNIDKRLEAYEAKSLLGDARTSRRWLKVVQKSRNASLRKRARRIAAQKIEARYNKAYDKQRLEREANLRRIQRRMGIK